jgi:hypothetical protein
MASKQFRGWFVCAAAVGALALYATEAQAAGISGLLAIDNAAGGGVTVTPTTITWLPPCCSGSGGEFLVGATSTGSFASLTTGNALNLNTTNEPVGAAFPLGAPIVDHATDAAVQAVEGNVLPGFLTFTGGTPLTLQFDLNFIQPGVFTSTDCGMSPAPGQTCTLPGTAFDFVNTSATSSTVSINLSGFVRDTANPSELSTFTGLYQTTFSNLNFQQVIAQLESTGGITSTYSGTFNATVAAIPEPVTMMTFGTGVALIARRLRRRRAA